MGSWCDGYMIYGGPCAAPWIGNRQYSFVLKWNQLWPGQRITSVYILFIYSFTASNESIEIAPLGIEMLNVKCQFHWQINRRRFKERFRVRTSQYSFECEKSHFILARARNFPTLSIRFCRARAEFNLFESTYYISICSLVVAIKYEDIISCENMRMANGK